MSWSDQSFKERFRLMGAPAEEACQQWAVTKNVELERFGFDSTKIKMFWKFPAFLRATPDYVAMGKTPFFIEVKGCGRAPAIKLKEVTLNELEEWNIIMDVWFFFYDSHNKQIAFENYWKVNAAARTSPTSTFQEGNKFYQVNKKHFNWTDFKVKEEKYGY